MRLPQPIAAAKHARLAVFGRPFSANLIVLRGVGGPGDWDGLLTLSWAETLGGAWRTISAPAATRPGPPYLRDPMNPGGTFMLAAPFQNRGSHKLGFHHRGQRNASRAFEQAGPVAGHRDIVPGDDRHTAGLLVYDATGVAVHRCTDPRQLAGCIGVQPDPLDEVLDAFAWLQARFTQPTVSLSVIDG